uniref:Uncharacterized protein n=1 Tax=Parasitella parasitica TaxID=35722 RepID=Q8J0K0_9FUNG|nr:hypothetical protein [Parasitella parasitica]
MSSVNALEASAFGINPKHRLSICLWQNSTKLDLVVTGSQRKVKDVGNFTSALFNVDDFSNDTHLNRAMRVAFRQDNTRPQIQQSAHMNGPSECHFIHGQQGGRGRLHKERRICIGKFIGTAHQIAAKDIVVNVSVLRLHQKIAFNLCIAHPNHIIGQTLHLISGMRVHKCIVTHAV